MNIREAQNEDAAALARLSAELGYPATSSQVDARLRQVMESSGHCVMVAFDPQGGVHGWVHVFIAPRVESDLFAELGGLVVAEGARGQGIGRGLVEAAARWTQTQGVDTLRVRTRSDRRGAHAFYERLGFERTKVQRVYSKPLS